MTVFRVSVLAFFLAIGAGMIFMPEVMEIISKWSAIAFGVIVLFGVICFFCWPFQIRPQIRNTIHSMQPAERIKHLDVAIDESGEIHLVWTTKDKNVYEGVYDVYYQRAAGFGAEWSAPERLGLGTIVRRR